MKFSKRTYLLLDVLYIALFAALGITFGKEMFWLGGFLMISIVGASFWLAYSSELVPDSAHVHRVPK